MQNRVKAAWLRRWSCILACSATRAFALSLLERRPNPGTGVDIPSEQEVLRDDRLVDPCAIVVRVVCECSEFLMSSWEKYWSNSAK